MSTGACMKLVSIRLANTLRDSVFVVQKHNVDSECTLEIISSRFCFAIYCRMLPKPRGIDHPLSRNDMTGKYVILIKQNIEFPNNKASLTRRH